MKAMLLAAGLGKRLRPITDTTPKPLLEVGGRSLIEHQLERLREAGIQEVVINLHHLGDQIQSRLGDGALLPIQLIQQLHFLIEILKVAGCLLGIPGNNFITGTVITNGMAERDMEIQ
jgi:NDP-sugar pyrophosphorylase family protein